MKGKLIGFALALLSVATVGVVQMQAEAIDNSRDCDRYAVVHCGTMSEAEARNKYNNGDNAAIFKNFGISRDEISGMKQGVVYRDGTVRVGGKVVARNAVTAIRHFSGGNIPGSSTAKRVSVSRMADAQTALVKFDQNGRFMFAIMKPCGNPVTGNPTPPPAQPEANCKSLTLNKLERTKFHFNATATVKDGAKVTAYVFQVTRAGKVVESKRFNTSKLRQAYTFDADRAGNYRTRVTVKTSEGDRSGSNCVKQFTVQDQPSAVCKNLSVTKLSNTRFRFNATADVHRATIRSYIFEVLKDGAVIDTKTVQTTKETGTFTYDQTEPGDYTARVTVNTTLGKKTGPACEKPFTVDEEEEDSPDVAITKHVENVKYKRVGVNVEYEYQIAVTNTGDIDLENVKVTDTPETGVTLIGASEGEITDNTWNHTIPLLTVGETMNFTLNAKVPEYLAGRINNTVCVDAPEVPGNPDDCDDAEVDVPKPGEVEVCNPETGETITVPEEDADLYVPVGSPECEDEVTPPELPVTGPTETVLQIVGVTSLAGASAYYIASRRTLG